MSLAQKQKPSEPVIDFNDGAPDHSLGYDTPPSINDREAKSPARRTGTLIMKNEGTSYIDSANWRAILEEIHGVKEYIDDHGDSEEEIIEDDPYNDTSPALLLGIGRPMTKEELLMDIPPRSVADRLVSRFLKTSEPALVIIHVPKFQKEYEQFWKNPHDTSFTWIALLYSIMALSVSLYHRSEEPLPANMVNLMGSWNIFRKKAAQSLLQANYLAPGRYKAEALLLYALCEFYRSQDAQIGVSYLLGITIRLAMRMGYHRDSKHYPNLSAFDGEMRRRLWAVLCQLDILVSFQVGLPRAIQSWQSDAEMPSNLYDTDFDENCTQIPPARSEDERTPCLYTVAKDRIMKVFGQIIDLAYSNEGVSYDEILQIDRRLEEAHDSLPPFFQMRPIGQSIADPTDLVIRRYTLEILFQKCRIVLHRRYMTEHNSKYAYSRSVCLVAAKKTLRHHAEIWSESMPGGQLYAERYFINSLQNTDFLASSMILCLALAQESQHDNTARLEPQERIELVRLLESTHRIFEEARHRSVDTQKAFATISIMLRRVKGTDVNNLAAESKRLSASENDQLAFQPAPDQQQQQQMFNGVAASGMQGSMYNTAETPSYSSLDVIGDMLNTPGQLDWRLYDSRVFGYETANQETAWGPPPVPTESSGMDFDPYSANL
ncbi:hypothetical protein N7462_010198 [Penicillium macrosclerotiorum]|uniref:uncharacterized protein n=1 Tax=Penicillium macrosclerotiorum TaxID=303699 RepID=UPI002549AD35|nr:uncharacterized protein N7462_010198 [Penicillium macrosclerotiorum]KAJ5669128.1 hypothetical protein N7462_010198 [Penicillium macrosclerotiorum]